MRSWLYAMLRGTLKPDHLGICDRCAGEFHGECLLAQTSYLRPCVCKCKRRKCGDLGAWKHNLNGDRIWTSTGEKIAMTICSGCKQLVPEYETCNGNFCQECDDDSCIVCMLHNVREDYGEY